MTSKWIAFGVVAASALVLAGCGSKRVASAPNASNTYASNSTAGGGNQAAQTHALKSLKSYQVDASGMRINPMYAPANQSYYFTFNGSQLSPKSLAALQVQANYLATHPKAKIRLNGNTDDRGSREYNIGLGWRRDQSVARYLEQQGVRPSQIQMVSYGKERPVAFGNNPKSWSLNRRVDLLYKAV